MAQIGIIGAGSWGTALAWLLHNNGHGITMYSALEEEIRMLRESHENKDKLPGVILDDSIRFTTKLSEAIEGMDVVVMAVPSKFVRSSAHQMRDLTAPGQKIIDVAKGIEEGTSYTMSQIISEEIPQADVSVLSGPSHAEEVGRGIPTTIVVGSRSRETAEYLQNIFMNDVFRVYISPDILGIEIGAALKNVIALAAGCADGLGYGDNTKAALITRGIAEISRLGVAMGGNAATFAGLTGMGDLIVTCASMHSRNRRCGILIGQGKSLEEAQAEVKMVVEGVYSAKAVKELADKYNVEMPIITEVNKVLFEGKDPSDAVKDLMMRDRKIENPLIPWDE